MANLRVDKITSTETFETTGSVQFDGSGDYLSLADSSDWYFGSDNFTIECYVCPTASPSQPLIVGQWSDPYSWALQFSNNSNRNMRFLTNTASGITDYISSGEPVPLSQWSHLAAVRNGNTLTLYLNGKENDTFTELGTPLDINQVVSIGSVVGSQPYEGFISNVRVIKGVALYTSNFKPSMRELEVTAETVLLACQSKTDATLEKTGKTITVTGNAVANELTPGLLTPIVKSGGGSAITGSVEFDGNDDYLQVAANSDLSFTGDFTVEYWVYMSKSESNMRQIGSNNYYISGKNGNWYFGIHAESTPSIYFFTYDGQSNAEYAGTTYASSLNSWYHLAAARVGNTLTIYVNGVKVTSGTISKDIIDGADGGLSIGRFPYQNQGFHNGFISNLRIVKGTALYTDNFIPPTRELKRVPGTVLLCCQDPDSPLTEVTGKTITGYGDLHEATDVEMLTNGSFAGGYSTEWEAKNNANLSHSNGKLTVTSTQNYSGVKVKSAYLPSLVAGRKYVMTIDLESVTNTIRFGVVSGLTVDNISTAGRHSGVFTASAVTEVFIEKPTGSNSTFVLKSVSIRELNTPNGASNFTPQVGDDRQVTFEGVTKINTDAYFYFPTGNTESRTLNVATQASSSARGLFAGGYNYGNPAGSRPTSDVIDYITISSTGDALDFGDLTESRGPSGGVASPTRGVWMHGDKTASPYRSDTIDYVTISSKGNAQDFGNTISSHGHGNGNVSDSTRGICGGGNAPVVVNNIEYITIATTGNGQDFGDLTVAKYGITAVSSPTRGVFSAGDKGPAFSNTMDYITIQSMGNALDFGDGITDTSGLGGASNSIRGLFANGFTSPFQKIDYITIASTGNAQSFGDLGTDNSRFKTGTSSLTRAVFAGGYGPSPGYSGRNDIEYVTIMSLGNAVDFGNLTSGRAMAGGCSNGHGGLG